MFVVIDLKFHVENHLGDSQKTLIPIFLEI